MSIIDPPLQLIPGQPPASLVAAPLRLTAPNSATVPLTLQAAAGQTADLLDVFASDGVTKRVQIDSAGNAFFLASGNINTVKIGQGLSGGNSGAGIAWSTASSIGDQQDNSLIIRSNVGVTITGNNGPTTALALGLAGIGAGNGVSTNLTALAKGTGVGPASDAVNTWLPVTLNGTAGWLAFFV